MPKQHRTRSNGGFTLVEVLAAVALLSMGLLAVITASKAGREMQQKAVFVSIGRNIAQGRMEALRSLPSGSLDGQAGSTTSTSLPSGNSVQTTVAGYPTTSETNMRLVTVTVSWPEASGTRTIRYESLIVRK